MTPDDIRAVMDEVDRRQRHQWAPATVTRAVTSAGFTSIVEVVMDNDQSDQSVQVANLLALPLAPGNRVMVVFDPPNGAYVIGILGGIGPVPIGRLQCATGLDGSVVTWECAATLDGGMTEDANRLAVPVAGMYSTTARLTVDGACEVILNTDDSLILDRTFMAAAGSVLLASAASPVPTSAKIQLSVFGAGVVIETPGTHLAAFYVAPYRITEVCGTCSGA